MSEITTAELQVRRFPICIALAWLLPIPIVLLGFVAGEAAQDRSQGNGFSEFVASVLVAGMVSIALGIVALVRRERFFWLAIAICAAALFVLVRFGGFIS